MNGWLAIGGLVAAYDACALWNGQPTLSQHHYAACDAHPWLVAAGTAYLITHLWGKFPKKADPFLAFAWCVGQVALKVQGTLSTSE